MFLLLVLLLLIFLFYAPCSVRYASKLVLLALHCLFLFDSSCASHRSLVVVFGEVAAGFDDPCGLQG